MRLRTLPGFACTSSRTVWSQRLRTAVVVGISGSSLLNRCQLVSSAYMSAIWPCGSAFQSNTASSGKASKSFPKQDFLKPGRYGNAIRGPLGIHRGAGQRFWFCGAEGNIEAQMRYLNSVPKVTREQLARLIAGKAMPPQLVRPKRTWYPGEPAFRILDHIHTPLHALGTTT